MCHCHANFLYVPGVVTIPTQDIAWWHLPGKNGKKVSVSKAIMQRSAKLKNSEEPVRKLHKLHQRGTYKTWTPSVDPVHEKGVHGLGPYFVLSRTRAWLQLLMWRALGQWREKMHRIILQLYHKYHIDRKVLLWPNFYLLISLKVSHRILWKNQNAVYRLQIPAFVY